MSKAKAGKTLRFRVDLEGVWPPVWRRILVSDRITLADLHEVIQAAFGWQDYHLHEFTVRGVRYGDPESDEYGELDLRDEGETRLWKLGLAEGEQLEYVYDFGDDWRHTLRVERLLPSETAARLPQCIGGERACPPEDVGGVGGYAEFRKALADPTDPEHASHLEWAGGSFDPEGFDPEAASQRMAQRARDKRAGARRVPEEEGGAAPPPDLEALTATARSLREHESAAREIPLRRDVETFLGYLREHKVTGTQSTGNLPLKAVAEIAAAFVHPPSLELGFGSHVYRFRSEDDVWPVYFVHLLAECAGLISGGQGRRWRLTPTAEQFLSAPAAPQVVILLAAWWYRANWLVAVPFNVFGEELPPQVRGIVLSMLAGLSVGQAVELGPFVDRLIEEVGWAWTPREPDYTRTKISAAVERMVIDPLEEFGALSAVRAKDPDSHFGLEMLVSFALTSFGRVLLEAVR